MQEITLTPLEALAQLKAVASLIDTAECKDEAMYNELQGALVVAQTALAMAPKQEEPTAYMHTLAERVFSDSGWNTQFLHSEAEAKAELSSHGGTITALYAAPAAANGALTDADILGIIWKYSSFISVGNYSSTQFDCQADMLNCIRAILAAAGPDSALVKAIKIALASSITGQGSYGANYDGNKLAGLVCAALSGAKGN